LACCSAVTCLLWCSKATKLLEPTRTCWFTTRRILKWSGENAADITEDIEPLSTLPNARDLFKAYSYMSEHYQMGGIGEALYAWPVFMLAQGGGVLF
jgi:hypothetical protein